MQRHKRRLRGSRRAAPATCDTVSHPERTLHCVRHVLSCGSRRPTRRGYLMKSLSIAALALAVFSLSPPQTGAQTQIPLMTVDAVNVGYPQGTLAVTGVVAGESAPSTRTVDFSFADASWKLAHFEACHRSLLFALSKPGQYVARVGPNICTVALVAP